MLDFSRNQNSILSILFSIFCSDILFCVPVFAQDEHLLRFYSLAVPAAQDFTKRTINESKTLPCANRTNFQVHTLFDNLEILTAANIDLPTPQRPTLENATALLQIAEEMQDQEPASSTFGNFRWYWNTPKVTDRNAVVFVAARAIPCWFEGQEHYSKEAKTILKRVLERSIAAALTHKVLPDYTNIALSDAIVLILLGQIFERADVIQEGEKRLGEIQWALWEHGIAEYNSPPYSAIDTDMLQLGLRYIQNETTKTAIRKMLNYLARDFSLHWFRNALRLAGSQSRTYQYLHGVDAHSTRLAAIAGLGNFEPHAKYAAMLNSFRSAYKMPPEIAEWNGQFPRFIERRWGTKTGQWSAASLFEDIALGTAGTSYHSGSYDSGSDLLLTVDLPNKEQSLDLSKRHFLPRCYFIPDGRNDPFGTKHLPTGKAGHLKALHLNPVWIATQRKSDALCFVQYPLEMLADSSLECIKSQFVLRQPDEQRQWNNTYCFRYQSATLGIRILFAENVEGKTVKAKLISGETDEAIRLEIAHDAFINDSLSKEKRAPTAIFWIRIGSHVQDFAEWSNAFHSANVDHLACQDSRVAVCVDGEFGKLSIHADMANNSTVSNAVSKSITKPSAPTGILTRNGKDIGRPILEEIPAIQRFVQNYSNAETIVVPANFEAANGVSFFANKIDDPIEKNTGGRTHIQSMLLNNAAYWKIKVDQAGKYYFSCRVLAKDPQHDSLYLNIAEESPNLFWTEIVNTAWHLGSSDDWRDVRFAKPFELKAGTYRLALLPREPDVQIETITIQQADEGK